MALIFAKDFFGRRSAVRDLYTTFLLWGINATFMKRLSCAALAQEHQSFVDHDASQPGRKRRVLSKRFEAYERALKGALHNILRVLLVPKDAKSRAIRLELVTLIELSKSVVMA